MVISVVVAAGATVLIAVLVIPVILVILAVLVIPVAVSITAVGLTAITLLFSAAVILLMLLLLFLLPFVLRFGVNTLFNIITCALVCQGLRSTPNCLMFQSFHKVNAVTLICRRRKLKLRKIGIHKLASY